MRKNVQKLAALFIALSMLFSLAAYAQEDTYIGGNPDDTGTSDPVDESVDKEGSTNESRDSSEEDETDSSDSIVFGHIADLTGNNAASGTLASKALEFAVDYFNQQGGVNGREIKIAEADSKSNTNNGYETAKTLVETYKASVIIGPGQYCQRVNAAKFKMPFVSYNETPESYISDNDYIIGLGGSSNQLTSVMAKYLYEDLGYRSIVLITTDNVFGDNYVSGLIDEFESLGGVVKDQLRVPSDATNTSTYMMQARNSGAEAIIAWLTGNQAIDLWGQWFDQGVYENIPMQAMASDRFTDYNIWEAVSASHSDEVTAALNTWGVYASAAYAYGIQNDENEQLLEFYENYDWGDEADTYGSIPVGSNIFGEVWSAVEAVVAAMETLDDPTDSEALYEALQDTYMATPEGDLYIDSTRTAIRDIRIVRVVQLDDGTFNYNIVKTYKSVAADGSIGTTITVDKDSLEDAILEAEKLNSEDYTAKSWANLETALNTAEEIMANNYATQKKVDTALENLEEAVASLKSPDDPADINELEKAIAEAETLTESDYTAESWANLETALNAAKDTLANEDATQEQIDVALVDLEEAMASLELKPEEITIYIQPESTTAEPGETIDVSYSIGPVSNLMRLSLTVSEPEGVEFVRIIDAYTLMERMFYGEGESSSSGRSVQAYAYYQENAFSCNENFYLFSARYNIPEDSEDREVTFGFESAEFRVASGNTVNVNVVSEPLQITYQKSGICGDNLTWFYDGNETLTISGTGDMYDYTSMGQAPWSSLMSKIHSVVIEDGATSIGSNAFFGFSFITSVAIADTVESIGDYAFMSCSGITELTIPDSMISIGYAAFESCKQLCDVDLGNGLVTIGDYAFSYCSNITSISVPDSVTSIGISAFYSCNNLAEVTLGKSLTSIGNYAFNQCYAIKEIIIPSKVTYIGDYAFNQCANLTKISFEGDAPSFGVYCFMLDEATAYYPHDNGTWTADVMKNYGGSITWETEDHDWGAVTWKWSDDYKSATASRTCSSCGMEESAKATISSITVKPTATEDGETTYIAVAIFNDLTLASDSKVQILAATGTPSTVKNGFAQDGSNWYYYVNGNVDTSCNDVIEGTVNGTSGWWYVEGGQVQLNYTGVANYANSNGWWYIENGKVNFNKTGIEPNDYGWWRVVNGKVDFSCNSVEQNDYGWWYIVGGKVDFSYTGVANYANAYGWWYINGGKVDFSKNSVEQNNYGWWYVVGGKVDFSYTGVGNYCNDYGWWYISGGKVDFSKTSVEQNNFGWWRVENGKVNFSFTGWATNNYGRWYCVNGKVDFSKS